MATNVYYLYYYSTEEIKSVKSIREQINTGMITDNDVISDVERADTRMMKHLKRRMSTGIQVMFDPIPVELIESEFPNNSAYKKSGTLYEYAIDTRYLDLGIEWTLDNHPIKPWVTPYKFITLYNWSSAYRWLYDAGRWLDDKMLFLDSHGSTRLRKRASKFKGNMRKYFMIWINDIDFLKSCQYEFDTGIPKFILYPRIGNIEYVSMRKIEFTDSSSK